MKIKCALYLEHVSIHNGCVLQHESEILLCVVGVKFAIRQFNQFCHILHF